jgi:RNA-directed DNA polymerase
MSVVTGNVVEAGVIPAGIEVGDGIAEVNQGAANCAGIQRRSTPDLRNIMELVVGKANMQKAYRKVVSNGGSAGVDEVKIEDMKDYIDKYWPGIKEQMLTGKYKPKPVRGVRIPKPNGGIRQLGIPTVMDRIIQQALYQILSLYFDPEFSKNSYGFRSGKSAHHAILKAKEFQSEGKRWVVDLDLAKFFDEVNHDVLMRRVKAVIKDKAVLKLVNRYLSAGIFEKAGIMQNGKLGTREKGTPQGGNLSPLLANIILDDLDKELEKRGHSFCRYADDCNIYIRSQRSGQRVMKSLTRYIELVLKLKVNQEKSAVARPWERKFLGYSFTNNIKVKIRVAAESVRKFKESLKAEFRKGRGRNLKKFIRGSLNPKIRGWIQYFNKADVKTFAEEIDGWIRSRLRNIIWKQWKRPWTRKVNLIKAGLVETQAVQSAFNGRGAYWNSIASHTKQAFPKKHFEECGLISMLDYILGYQKSIFGTAVYGTVCTVV